MVVFWVVAGALAAAAAGLILMRAAGAAAGAGGADPAQAVYRRQLTEIDDLAERGLLGEAEAKAARAEASRRLLDAAEAAPQAWSADPGARLPILLAVAVTSAVALGLYLTQGAPGAPDQPYAQRLQAWREGDLMRLRPAEAAAVLRQVVRERPDDAEGYRLLGMVEGAAQNPLGAVSALRKAAALAPQRPEIWQMLGEAQISAAGKVDADAQAAFRRLLTLQPGNPSARYFLAQGKAEAGDPAGAVADLRALLADLPTGDERRGAVEATIAQVAGQPAPTQNPDQLAMIQGMVEGLASRLKSNPDDAEGWVRLVRAYAVLGETQKRDDAYATARARYADRPQVVQQLDEAARAERMP